MWAQEGWVIFLLHSHSSVAKSVIKTQSLPFLQILTLHLCSTWKDHRENSGTVKKTQQSPLSLSFFLTILSKYEQKYLLSIQNCTLVNIRKLSICKQFYATDLGRKLLYNLWGVWCVQLLLLKRYHHKELKELLLLKLNEVPLQSLVVGVPPGLRLHLQQAFMMTTYGRQATKWGFDRQQSLLLSRKGKTAWRLFHRQEED